MAKETKHFHVDGLFKNEDNKYTLDEFIDMLIEWAESKEISIYAAYSEVKDEEEVYDIEEEVRYTNDQNR